MRSKKRKIWQHCVIFRNRKKKERKVGVGEPLDEGGMGWTEIEDYGRR